MLAKGKSHCANPVKEKSHCANLVDTWVAGYTFPVDKGKVPFGKRIDQMQASADRSSLRTSEKFPLDG